MSAGAASTATDVPISWGGFIPPWVLPRFPGFLRRQPAADRGTIHGAATISCKPGTASRATPCRTTDTGLGCRTYSSCGRRCTTSGHWRGAPIRTSGSKFPCSCVCLQIQGRRFWRWSDTMPNRRMFIGRPEPPFIIRYRGDTRASELGQSRTGEHGGSVAAPLIRTIEGCTCRMKAAGERSQYRLPHVRRDTQGTHRQRGSE